MDLDDFDDDEVSPWVRRGAPRRRPRARCYLVTEMIRRTDLMNYSIRLQEANENRRPLH